jgi:hypothetical protein
LFFILQQLTVHRLKLNQRRLYKIFHLLNGLKQKVIGIFVDLTAVLLQYDLFKAAFVPGLFAMPEYF